MYSLSDSRGNTFSGTAFFSHKFNDKNSMDWQIAYDYSDNSYHRSYSESAMDNLIRSNTKEYLNNFETRLNYRYQLNSKSSLGLFVWETYMKSNARYAMTDGDNS